MSDPVSCIVISPVRFNGKRYEIDDLVDLPPKWAERLIVARVVRLHQDGDGGPNTVRVLIDLIKSGQDPEAMTVKAVNEATGLKLKKADIEAALIDGDCHVTALAELHSVEGIAKVIDHISNCGDQVIGQDNEIDPELVAASYEESERPAEPMIATAIAAINLNHEIGGNE